MRRYMVMEESRASNEINAMMNNENNGAPWPFNKLDRLTEKLKKLENFLEDKTQDGKNISPVLPKGIKNYLIDIDGTICDDIPNEEPERMRYTLYPDALDN